MRVARKQHILSTILAHLMRVARKQHILSTRHR